MPKAKEFVTIEDKPGALGKWVYIPIIRSSERWNGVNHV